MSNKLVKDLKINPIFKSVFGSDSYESNEALRLLIQSFLKRDVDQVILIHNEPLVGIINEKQIRMDILAKLKDGTKSMSKCRPIVKTKICLSVCFTISPGSLSSRK